jgi:hypothetical protein
MASSSSKIINALLLLPIDGCMFSVIVILTNSCYSTASLMHRGVTGYSTRRFILIHEARGNGCCRSSPDSLTGDGTEKTAKEKESPQSANNSH